VRRDQPTVAFLFLGETLLIPHLWPIVEALSAAAPDIAIDCWIATSVHEALLGRWSAGLANVCLRRAPGFKAVVDPEDGHNPPLPAKLPMLARLAPRLLGTRIAVCAEQTSLWIPTILPFHPTRFVKTSHGVGSMSARDDRRRRAAALMLVPSERERATYLQRGFPADRVRATGYVKASFAHHTPARALFPDDKPVVAYVPHWQRQRSSWWDWGRQVVAMLAAQARFNVILAPHQRLVETEPGISAALAKVADRPNVHADTQSFAMVDGSYMAAADIYLGDTSSQVVEFLTRPRPCIFLNPQALDWQATNDHDFWQCGDVIDRLDALPRALEIAEVRHAVYRERQDAFATSALGDTSGAAAAQAAAAILDILGRR
jgi:hypothetical protein